MSITIKPPTSSAVTRSMLTPALSRPAESDPVPPATSAVLDATVRGPVRQSTSPTPPKSPAPLLSMASPLSLVSAADLDVVIGASATLQTAADPSVRKTFQDAGAAAARLKKTVAVEMPLRLVVTTGKPNPLAVQGNRGGGMPQEVPGVVKQQGDQAVFYPANECIKPFPIAAEQAAVLPRDTVLIARATKKQAEFSLPDGAVEKATVYQLGGSAPSEPRPRFVGVVDFIAGEAFVKDLMPPARMVSLPATQHDGMPWSEGAIVDVAVADSGAVSIERTLARGGSPKARTWMIASESRLDAVFPASAEAEAKAIETQAVTSLADKALVDRRHEPFFAIDNPGSTDIDQCMRLEKRPDGGYVVSYALADPAAYIKPGMALFDEAMQRGASYYLPGLSIPMLPDVLSQGVISLNAHEDHRAMVIEIRLDQHGTVEGKPTVQRAVIHSQSQLTYEGVSAELEGQGTISVDEHRQPVPAAVRAQLALFQEIGAKRIIKSKERGVVEPDRREMHIGFDDGRFFLKDSKSNLASKLNAEFSILANVGGAQNLLSSTVPGLFLPGIFRTHDEPGAGAYQALARQANVVIRQHGLPDTWQWLPHQEPLSAWVDRLKTLPSSDRQRDLSLVLQQAAVRINVASEYQRQPGIHSGLKVDHYGRFSAPMREQVGLMSHAVVFAKDALERAVVAGGLSDAQAQVLWAPLLLGATVDPKNIPLGRRELARQSQALLSSSPTELAGLVRSLMAMADGQGPLSAEEHTLIDTVFDRATASGNGGKMKQGQVESAARKLLFDDLFEADLGGNPLGNPHAPKREGTVTAVTPGKVYIQLKDPDVEVRLGVDDLRRHCPQAHFRLEEEGCALLSDAADAGAVARLVVGGQIKLQATHHDGDRLHFTVVG
jgi:exoribonuclease R